MGFSSRAAPPASCLPSRRPRHRDMLTKMQAVLLAAALLVVCAAGQSQDSNKKPDFVYPIDNSKPIYNKLDTVMVSYISYTDTVDLWTFCEPGVARVIYRQDAPGFDSTVPILLNFTSDTPCWFNIRTGPEDSVRQDNSEWFNLLGVERAEGRTTWSLSSDATTSTSSSSSTSILTSTSASTSTSTSTSISSTESRTLPPTSTPADSNTGGNTGGTTSGGLNAAVNTSSESNGLSAGASAGIGIGAAIGVLVLAGLAFWYWRRRRAAAAAAAMMGGGYPQYAPPYVAEMPVPGATKWTHGGGGFGPYGPVAEIATSGAQGPRTHHEMAA